MTKAKKIIIGTLAAGLVAATTCIAASAYTERADYQINGGYGAVFSWGNGHASMENLRNQTRFASVGITSYDNTTGAYAGFNGKTNPIGYGETVTVDAGKTYPDYNFVCNGSIHTAASSNSPTEWTVSNKNYPQ